MCEIVFVILIWIFMTTDEAECFFKIFFGILYERFAGLYFAFLSDGLVLTDFFFFNMLENNSLSVVWVVNIFC